MTCRLCVLGVIWNYCNFVIFSDGQVHCIVELERRVKSKPSAGSRLHPKPNHTREWQACPQPSSCTEEQTHPQEQRTHPQPPSCGGMELTSAKDRASPGNQFVLALGVVRQRDVSLHLLELTSMCSCHGYSLSTRSRGTYLPVHTHIPLPRQSVTTPPPTTPLSSVLASTGGLIFHKSPQIHLYRSQVRIGRGQGGGAKQRSTSVPDLRRRRGRGGVRKGRGISRVGKGFSTVDPLPRFSSESPVKAVHSLSPPESKVRHVQV